VKSKIRHLDSVHSQLAHEIANVPSELLSKRPSENEWSVGEVIHHLLLVEQRVLDELEKGVAQPPQRIGLLKNLIPMQLISWRFVRVSAPNAVMPAGFKNAEESMKTWKTCRTRLKQFCTTIDPKRLKQTAFRHPFLGNINGLAAISMVAYHEERHYKQIKEILAKIE
jgi:hypothetical protein